MPADIDSREEAASNSARNDVGALAGGCRATSGERHQMARNDDAFARHQRRSFRSAC